MDRKIYNNFIDLKEKFKGGTSQRDLDGLSVTQQIHVPTFPTGANTTTKHCQQPDCLTGEPSLNHLDQKSKSGADGKVFLPVKSNSLWRREN